EFDEAIKDYTEALLLAPKSAQAFEGRGLTYLDKGDNDHAIQDFTEAIALEPNFAQALQERGIAYIDPDHAIQDFTRAIALEPSSTAKISALSNRAILYVGKR